MNCRLRCSRVLYFSPSRAVQMLSSRPPSSPLRFGPFEVDLSAAELRKRGRRVPLQDQPFKVLALLLQRPGELVTREELQKALWPGDTFGEFDEGLNKAVQKLRQALDDSSDNPRFVATLPRKGYRFIAEVESSTEERAAPELQPGAVHDSAVSTPGVGASKRGRTEVLAWLLFGIVSLALLVFASIRFWPTRSTSQPVLRAAPLTSYPGRQIHPALSPDGKQVAFAWDGERGDNFDIYVKLVNAGAPLRLTNNPAVEYEPAWSPDGRYIAFCRILPDHVETWMIPALGGTERKLAESAGWCGGLSWSPDGKFLALVDKSTPQAPLSIFLLSIETGDKRKMTSPPSEYIGDLSPRFSPDGKDLAFQRNGVDNIYVLPVTDAGTPGGEPHRLILDKQWIPGFDWTRDSRRIVYASVGATGSTVGLWTTRVSGGTREQLSVAVENPRELSIARSANRLVYVREVFDDNIWQFPGPNPTEADRAPMRLIASTQTDDQPQYSRTGDKIAFISARSGNPEVWICDREGHNSVQLTSFDGPEPGSPSWSPDERWIAFDCFQDGKVDLYVVSSAGGVPRRLTKGPSNNVRPVWSRDGRSLYFGSRRSGESYIWKIPVQGGAAVPIVNTKGGFQAFESSDGKWVYYVKENTPGIWKVTADGGEATRVLEQGVAGAWSLTDQGICYLNFDDTDATTLRFFSFAEQKASLLRKLPKETRIGLLENLLSATADGRWIIYTQSDQVASDLMLVENFR